MGKRGTIRRKKWGGVKSVTIKGHPISKVKHNRLGILSFSKAASLGRTPGSKRLRDESRSGIVAAMSQGPIKPYWGQHLSSFIGPNESALKEELLKEPGLYEVKTNPGNEIVRRDDITADMLGDFLHAVLNRALGNRYKYFFTFENYILEYRSVHQNREIEDIARTLMDIKNAQGN